MSIDSNGVVTNEALARYDAGIKDIIAMRTAEKNPVRYKVVKSTSTGSQTYSFYKKDENDTQFVVDSASDAITVQDSIDSTSKDPVNGVAVAAKFAEQMTTQNINSIIGYTPMDSSIKGAANGVASLDGLGQVPTSQLPLADSYSPTGTKPVTGTVVAAALATLPEPMVFKGTVGTGGTVTSLPTAATSNKGHTYKAITANVTSGSKIGDTFISNGSEWVIIPSGDEPSGTVTQVGINASSGSHLSASGTVNSSGNLTVGVESGYQIPSSSDVSQITTNKTNILYTLKTGVKNLLVNVGVPQTTYQGVQYTRNTDGSVTCERIETATAGSAYQLNTNINIPSDNLILSVQSPLGTGNFITVNYTDNTRTTLGGDDTTTYVALDSNKTVALAYIWYGAPTTETLTIYPMICTVDAWNQSHDFEKGAYSNTELTENTKHVEFSCPDTTHLEMKAVGTAANMNIKLTPKGNGITQFGTQVINESGVSYGENKILHVDANGDTANLRTALISTNVNANDDLNNLTATDRLYINYTTQAVLNAPVMQTSNPSSSTSIAPFWMTNHITRSGVLVQELRYDTNNFCHRIYTRRRMGAGTEQSPYVWDEWTTMELRYTCVTGADYNDFNKTGFYEALGTTTSPTQNAPDGLNVNNNYYVITQRRSPTYFVQIATNVRANDMMFIRTYSNGTWNSWHSIATQASLRNLVDESDKNRVITNIDIIKQNNNGWSWVGNTASLNGVTITVNDDLTLVASGQMTASSALIFTVINRITDNINIFKETGYHYIHGNLGDNSSSISFRCNYTGNNVPVEIAADTSGNGTPFNVTDEMKNSANGVWYLFAANSPAFSNVHLKPMICKCEDWYISNEYVPPVMSHTEAVKQINENTGKIQTLNDKMAELIDTKIYGFKISKTDNYPSTRVEYMYDAVGMRRAYMDYNTNEFNYGDWGDVWFVKENRPVALKYDRTVDYELDPTDYWKKKDGTASDLEDPTYAGNFMSEIPLIYIKRWEDDDYCYCAVSNKKVDDGFKADAFTKADGTISTHIYYPMFAGSLDSNNRLRSIAGVHYLEQTSIADEITYAENNGANYQIKDLSKHDLLTDLLILMGKSTNIQFTFGIGITGLTVEESDVLLSGYNVKDGSKATSAQFWGGIQNGTVFANDYRHIKVFHIEDFWGSAWQDTIGANLDADVYKVRTTPPYAVSPDATYQTLDVTVPSEDWLRQMYFNANGHLPTVTGSPASNTMCYCTRFYKTATNIRSLATGGSSTQGYKCSPFFYNFQNAVDAVPSNKKRVYASLHTYSTTNVQGGA